MIYVLLLTVPLVAAAFCARARTRGIMEGWNLASSAGGFVRAVILSRRVLREGPVSLWDGFLYADQVSALVILLTTSVVLVCAFYAIGYLREEERSGALASEEKRGAPLVRLRRHYTFTPLFAFSMALIALANNLGVLWVAIEATTLASVFLVALYEKPTSLEAAWKYAILGGVGLSMALFGTILVYYAGHAVPSSDTWAGRNWSFLAERAGQLDKTTMRLAFILALLGYGTKAGLAPMHTWKPEAYGEAPVPAAALLSTATLNCALYGLRGSTSLATGRLVRSSPDGYSFCSASFRWGFRSPLCLFRGTTGGCWPTTRSTTREL